MIWIHFSKKILIEHLPNIWIIYLGLGKATTNFSHHTRTLATPPPKRLLRKVIVYRTLTSTLLGKANNVEYKHNVKFSILIIDYFNWYKGRKKFTMRLLCHIHILTTPLTKRWLWVTIKVLLDWNLSSILFGELITLSIYLES